MAMGNYEIDARFALTAAEDCGSSEWARETLKRYLLTGDETGVEKALSEYGMMCLHQAKLGRNVFDPEVQKKYWLEGGHNRVTKPEDCKVKIGWVRGVEGNAARVGFGLMSVAVIFDADLIKPIVGDKVAVHKGQIAMKL
jgi:hypothetical protein